MGLLDEAIREHLDLKRRRGADPAEIERAEREALGPVRRNREPGLAEDGEPQEGIELDPALGSARDEPDGGTASDLAEESYGDSELFGEEEPDAVSESDADREADRSLFIGESSPEEDDLFDEDDEFPADDDEDPFAEDDEEPLAEEDPHRTQLMRTVDVPVPEDATAEHDVEEAFAEEDARPIKRSDEDDEDMLEETPEFLQDTPDHDRLWFEQRPPRDFDFDG